MRNHTQPCRTISRLAAVLLFALAISAPAQQAPLSDEAPDVLYIQGINYFTAGRYAEAAAAFKALVDQFGNEPELQKDMETAFYALGCSLYNVGDYAGAVDAFKQYISRYPKARFVDEAQFRIGSACQAQADYPAALAAYEEVMERYAGSPFTEDAGYQVAICQLEQERYDKAITAFEAFLTANPGSDLFAQAKTFLARACLASGKLAEALDALEAAQGQTRGLDHFVYANFLAIEIGDAAFDETDYAMALRADRRVRTKESMLRLQRQFVASREAELAAHEKQKVDPAAVSARFREARRLRQSLDGARQALQKLESMPDYDAGLFHRVGRCFFAVDRHWEARVAFTRVVAEATDLKVKEAGHFDLILVLNRMRRFGDLIGEADRYLAAFGADEALVKNGRVPSVAFLRAEAYVNEERFEEAEKEMRSLAAAYPGHPQAPRIEFYLALSIAMQERFAESIKLFRAWQEKHPQDATLAEVDYWLPIAMYYDGQYEAALPLLTDYAAKYPMSIYAPEAEYRAAMCKYALEQYRESALDLAAWLGRHAGHPFQWEALVTQGDACAAAGMLDNAKTAYLKVTSAGGAFHFLALQQVVKVYKALDTPAAYAEMAQVFTEFIRQNPESPHVVEAAYQARWALRNTGRTDDARRLYWGVVERYGNNRSWEGFGPLLVDLKKLYSDQPEGSYGKDLDLATGRARDALRMTLLSRFDLVRIRLGAAPTADDVAVFARRYTPDMLDAEGLAWLGDAFLKANDATKAATYFDRLLADFPASRFVAVACARKAEARLAGGAPEEALALAVRATEVADEPQLLMEATFTQAECLRELAQYDAAIDAYNQVVANRAAPRPLKPRALLGLAACHEGKGDARKAIPYYQRIYVMYAAYVDAMAEAYLKSGEAFEKIKDRPAAVKTYEEMLGVESLAGRPELEIARERLAKLQS